MIANIKTWQERLQGAVHPTDVAMGAIEIAMCEEIAELRAQLRIAEINIDGYKEHIADLQGVIDSVLNSAANGGIGVKEVELMQDALGVKKATHDCPKQTPYGDATCAACTELELTDQTTLAELRLAFEADYRKRHGLSADVTYAVLRMSDSYDGEFEAWQACAQWRVSRQAAPEQPADLLKSESRLKNYMVKVQRRENDLRKQIDDLKTAQPKLTESQFVSMAKERFGWAADLGGFDDAVKDLWRALLAELKQEPK